MSDKIVYEDKFFQVVSPQYPLNCREDGGHLVLLKKETVKDRSEMDWQEAIDFIRVSMIVGKAMYDVLGVERINYEDLGNWGVDKPMGSAMHLHFFGRAKKQTHQVRGNHMIIFPEGHNIYKGHLKPLTDEDVDALKKEIDIISQEEKFIKMAETSGV